MKGSTRKHIAGFLLLPILLGLFSVSAGAAVKSDANASSAQVSGTGTEAVVTEDSLVKGREEALAQLDISSAKWKKVGSNWRLKSSSGKYKTGFVKYNGSWYFFDSKGNMKVGWFKTGGKTYFASRTTGKKGKGKILTGIWKIDGKYYYYLNPSSKPHKGVMMTGFQKISGHRYYFASNGRMQTGWITVSGNKYYGSTAAKTRGQLLTGTQKIGGTTYKFDANGKLVQTVAVQAVSKAASAKYMHMIDVSEHQGTINFKKVKAAGVKGVMIRAGYGKLRSGDSFHTDKFFYKNIKNAKAAGLYVGIYWFSYAYTRQQAVNEAAHLAKLLKGYKLNLPVYFDWEYDSMTKAQNNMSKKSFKNTNWRNNITDMTVAFCNTLSQKGYRAGYYFNLHYLNTYYTPSKLSKYSTWYAFWGNNKPGSTPWTHANKMSTPTKYDIWQFTSRGRINGISGYVDCDLLLKPGLRK